MALEYILPIPLIGFMVATYQFTAPEFQTSKQRAYILSTLSSSVCSAVSIPFFGRYALYGLHQVYEESQSGWMALVGKITVVFFATYLFTDLALGYIKYPSQIGLLTGWIHHTVYIGLMIFCLSTQNTPIFLMGAIMEIPTLDLALSNLFPMVRNDLRFLSSFFALRILFNLILLIDLLRPSSRTMMGGTWIPSGMLFLAGLMHVSWFRGGLLGYLKRRRGSGVGGDKVRVEIQRSGLVVDMATAVDPTVLDSTLPPTPDDSPLVTPHTPFTLRDSYMPTLFPLPAIPSFLDLSAAVLPTKSDMSGFKEAVKSRWEEQKGKFGARGRGGRGGDDAADLRNRQRQRQVNDVL